MGELKKCHYRVCCQPQMIPCPDCDGSRGLGVSLRKLHTHNHAEAVTELTRRGLDWVVVDREGKLDVEHTISAVDHAHWVCAEIERRGRADFWRVWSLQREAIPLQNLKKPPPSLSQRERDANEREAARDQSEYEERQRLKQEYEDNSGAREFHEKYHGWDSSKW